MRPCPLWLVAVLALAACSAVPANTFTELPARGSEPHVELHYLGNGGWLISRGQDRIAFAPFVSNPHGLTLLFPRKPDTALIDDDAVVPPMHDVGAILVGHGHYDHAMDLPYIHETKAPRATIYGSRSVVNTLSAVERLKKQLHAITDGDAASGDTPGKWLPGETSRVRFMPLRSTHAPHFAGLKLIPWWRVGEKQTALPCCPYWWKEGETFAFIVDFLDARGEGVEFRIYYQDAASEPGTGITPLFTGRHAAPIDVAILCVAAFDQVPDNPEHILRRLRPRAVIGGHWEDFFFQSYRDRPRRPAFGTSLEAFHRRATAVLPKRPIYLPEPGQRVYLPITPR